MMWWFLSVALAGVSFSEPELVADAEVSITLTEEGGAPLAGVPLKVVSNPGTALESSYTVGLTDGSGRVRWTPKEGGPHQLRYGDNTEVAQVRWDRPPLSASLSLLILLAAFLGCIFFLRSESGRPKLWRRR